MASRVRRLAFAGVVAGSMAGGMVMAGAGLAAADYGNTAVYQVEISANGNNGPFGGGGAWLWIELDSNNSGTYQGADCGHGGGGGGAVHDSGTVSWSSANGVLTIHGVVFNGLGGLPVTVTVPSTYGNQRESILDVFGIPFPGFAEVTVAP